MAITAQLIQQQEAKYSENIINPYMTFNNAFTYTFSSGSGNATVTNSDENTLIGAEAMKIRALNTSACYFNAADLSESTVKVDGIHNIQWAVYKSDPDAVVDLTVEVFIDGVLTADRTIEAEISTANGFVNDKWNLFFQSFSALKGDVITLAWRFQSDTSDCIVYLDAFKIDAVNQGNLYPTLYTNPPFLINKNSRLYNFTDTQTLFEDTAVNFSLFDGTVETNCGSEILVEGVGFKPTRLNSFFTVNVNFLAKVPAGTDIHIDAELLINGVVYYGDCKFLNKPVDEFQYINFNFQLHCNEDFLEFEGAVELTARGEDIVISNRTLTVSETVNQN